jgi:hypothetical protein
MAIYTNFFTGPTPRLCRGHKGIKPEYKYLLRTTTVRLCRAVVDYNIGFRPYATSTWWKEKKQ